MNENLFFFNYYYCSVIIRGQFTGLVPGVYHRDKGRVTRRGGRRTAMARDEVLSITQKVLFIIVIFSPSIIVSRYVPLSFHYFPSIKKLYFQKKQSSMEQTRKIFVLRTLVFLQSPVVALWNYTILTTSIFFLVVFSSTTSHWRAHHPPTHYRY